MCMLNWFRPEQNDGYILFKEFFWYFDYAVTEICHFGDSLTSQYWFR